MWVHHQNQGRAIKICLVKIKEKLTFDTKHVSCRAFNIKFVRLPNLIFICFFLRVVAAAAHDQMATPHKQTAFRLNKIQNGFNHDFRHNQAILSWSFYWSFPFYSKHQVGEEAVLEAFYLHGRLSLEI